MVNSVAYISACLDSSGYAEAARNHIAALHTNGVKVTVTPISFEQFRSELGELGALIHSLVGSKENAPVHIVHSTPNLYDKIRDNNKYNIGYAAWETSLLPKEWVAPINRMNEMWVPSEHNKQAFINSGVNVPIFVMPHPFDISYGSKSDIVTVLANKKPDDFAFYSIFQWLERKNPTDLIKAYLTEFMPNEKVVLVLKTYIVNPNNDTESGKIKEYIATIKANLHIKEFPRILLITSLLSRQQIVSVHKECDAYVSMHRCEGFGIPIVEAMLCNKPVIVTGYGAPEEFIEDKKSGFIIPYTMTPCYGMPWGTYTGHMNWADPDIMATRKLMRYAFENKEQIKVVGEVAGCSIRENYNWDVLGKRMKDRLEQINV